MPEPESVLKTRKFSFTTLIFEPFLDFWKRNGTSGLVLILAFMFCYKLGDNMATALSTPFYMDLGFTKSEIGSIVKAAALWSSIVGGILGGLFMLKIGINRSLWIFGGVQMLTILGFAALSEIGPDKTWLFIIVSSEYLGVGLGTAAFVAYIARSTSKAYTAAQLALLTSFAGLPRSFASASTGVLIESMGYTSFFLLCTVLAIPGMILLIWVAPWNEHDSSLEGPTAKTNQPEKAH
jgi:PAT family beta-lactamase induction signal transducer AmpG